MRRRAKWINRVLVTISFVTLGQAIGCFTLGSTALFESLNPCAIFNCDTDGLFDPCTVLRCDLNPPEQGNP